MNASVAIIVISTAAGVWFGLHSSGTGILASTSHDAQVARART